MNKNSEKIDITVGKGSVLAESVVFSANCKKVSIGVGCYIGEGVYIDVPELNIGDYTTIHKQTTIHGYKACAIGHNCWVGQNTIIDSIGGATIGNNVGVGTYSQLWSHMKFGDMMAGCRWHSEKELIVEDDVWFVGHCIVSPILAEKGSMAMIGSVITRDMKANHVYAGTPAKDMTEKFGFQFQPVPYESKLKMFEQYYKEFLAKKNLRPSEFPILFEEECHTPETYKKDISVFFLESRNYIPTRSCNEIAFLKSMLYEKAKFIPII